MSLRSPLSASFGMLAAAVLASSAGAVPLHYSVVIAESDITSTVSVGATVDVNPDLLNQFPQFGVMSGTSNSQPTNTSYAVADVGLPGDFANGANGITFSELTFTTLPAPGVLGGFGAISVPFDLLGSNIQLIAYTVKFASLTLTLDDPMSSPLVPTGPNAWAWAGVGNVTLSGVILPIVDIPSDAVPPLELDPVPYSQSIAMPLAGTFSGDHTGTRVTLGIPQDALQDQALAIPPVAIPLDIGGLGIITGTFGLNGLVLADLSTEIVYQNATVIPEPNTAALLAIGLIGIALRHRRS